MHCGRASGRALTAVAGLALSLAVVGCSGSSGGGSNFGATTYGVDSSSAVVAILETVAGNASPFVIKGTIPVPPQTMTKKDQEPFTVLDYDGTPAPTQAEVVTFYPKASDGADVVEIMAKVHVPPSTAPGTKLAYEVVLNPHKKASFRLSKDMLGVMKTPDSVMLVTHDVFGNEYKLDLLEGGSQSFKKKDTDVLRNGVLAATLRTHGVLKPKDGSDGGHGQTGPSGALHHMHGAHAYATLWMDTGVMSLDIRVHNGLSGLDKSDPNDDPNTDLYFADLELWIPKGWSMFQQNPDPGLGQPYDKQNYTVFPILTPLAGGKMHFMPEQAQFHRRLALSAPGQEQLAQQMVDELGRAFARAGSSPTGGELWSWWNGQTARYFPQSFALADLSYLDTVAMETKFSQKLAQIRNLVAHGTAGTFPQGNPKLGFAHPWGVPYGGMTGGDEIQQWDGIQIAFLGSQDGYRLSQLTHRMYSDRKPDVLFNLDGSPTRLEQWIKQGNNGQYVPMAFYQKLLGNNDPFGFNVAPTAHVEYVQGNNLKPPYEGELDKFKPIDFQHYTRYTRSAKVLAWLGNDPIAKDDLKMAAELFRLSYHKLPQSASGYVGNGMLSDWNAVQKHPGTGFGFGRGEGWGIDAMSSAYAMSDQAWRQEALPWFRDVADVVAQGQSSCNGFIQSIVSSKMLDGNYHTRQAIEQGIVENALRGMVETVFRGVDSGRTAQTEYVLEKSFYAMIGPMAWKSGSGPASYLAVGPLDKMQGTFCGSVPSDGAAGADHTQTYSSFAYAYQITGDQQFLQRASELFGAPGPNALLNALQSQGFNMVENRSALIASMQGMTY